ncbi:hypothetical protein [Streptomyces cucumeris]|uniref:hypothetical protein n=1 Tax=Streptomyces cucumeris TaxID=2962890 RepID=UPI0020C92509|nr:hypothetical protein [Streptomyces sp. NEAU-Y11]MCP9209554.1 hypothetical protein [Streptomyces sp. NEAU-Y11]
MSESLGRMLGSRAVIQVLPDLTARRFPGVANSPDISEEAFRGPRSRGEYELALGELICKQGWRPEVGWSNMNSGRLIMHPSEHIGERLEIHIRQTFGLWCLLSLDSGWIMAHRKRPTPKRVTLPECNSKTGLRGTGEVTGPSLIPGEFMVTWEDGADTSEGIECEGRDWVEVFT